MIVLKYLTAKSAKASAKCTSELLTADCRSAHCVFGQAAKLPTVYSISIPIFFISIEAFKLLHTPSCSL